MLMIVRPPGLPVTMNSLPSFARIVGVMLESIRLPRRREVRLRADQPLRRRQARAGVEVAHLVVQQEAGAGHDDLRRRSPARACRSSTPRCARGRRPRCASSRRSRAATRSVVGDDFDARSRLIVLRSVGGVVLRHQALDRHVRVEVRIAEVLRAIGEDAPHRLGDQVQRGRRAEAHRLEVVAFEDVQHLDRAPMPPELGGGIEMTS